MCPSCDVGSITWARRCKVQAYRCETDGNRTCGPLKHVSKCLRCTPRHERWTLWSGSTQRSVRSVPQTVPEVIDMMLNCQSIYDDGMSKLTVYASTFGVNNRQEGNPAATSNSVILLSRVTLRTIVQCMVYHLSAMPSLILR